MVGTGHRGRGGWPGVVLGGCDRPGLRAQREEGGGCSGRIQMPGCSPRGGDGQDGEGICPVQPGIGMEVGDATGVPLGEMVGLVGGAGGSTRGLESLFLPAPSGLTAPAPGGLSGAGQRGTGPCPSIFSPGMSAPQAGWLSRASGYPASRCCPWALGPEAPEPRLGWSWTFPLPAWEALPPAHHL